MSDVTFDMANNQMEVLQNSVEPWRVTLVDTGPATMTGGRLKRVREFVGDDDFCFTYGDGVADVDITGSIAHHQRQSGLATLTAVQPPGRFGALDLEQQKIVSFQEKPVGDGGRINGGFFVLSPGVFDYIADDQTVWEKSPLENLARDGQLSAFMHDGFWHPMDTLRDRNALETLWNEGRAPWKVWDDA
jgi:glucose-1-phosphate cytidylyltransferase